MMDGTEGWMGGWGMGSMDWAGGPWMIVLTLVVIAGIIVVARATSTRSITLSEKTTRDLK